jgi:antitoxin YefM
MPAPSESRRCLKIEFGPCTGILYNRIIEVFTVTETTYTNLRQSLASVLDRVANDHEVVIIVRKGEKKVAMVPADELAGLMETAHLLRSPKNAQRLLSALQRADGRKGRPESLEKLRREMGLGAQR